MSVLDQTPPPAIAELEAELQRTRDQLRLTIEELEGANEQLQTSNEELQRPATRSCKPPTRIAGAERGASTDASPSTS